MWSSAGLLLVLVSFYADLGVTSFSLTITPRHVRARLRDNVTVMCSANVEFSDCQFTWFDLDDESVGPVFNFSQGPNSEYAYLTNASVMNWRLAGYRYEGEGLHTGQCGIQLFGVLLRYRMVACRVRTLDNSWNYATMTVCAEAKEPAALLFAPTEPVVLPGANVSFLCQSTVSLANCNFRFPGLNPIKLTSSSYHQRNNIQTNNRNNQGDSTLSTRVNTPGRTSLWTEYGQGLNRGQCGVMLQQVSEACNGWVYFDAETVSGGFDRRVFYLTIAKSPAEAIMTLHSEVIDGSTYHIATCNVSESRPAANITWYLGNTVVRRDKLDDEPQTSWRWGHGLHTISQKLRLPARAEDNGKILKCQVDHVAMGRPLVAVVPLSVEGELLTQESKASTTCPALPNSNDVSLVCKFRGRSGDCSSLPLEIGTVATITPNCREGFALPEESRYIHITCTSSGEWDKRVPTCRTAESLKCPALLFSNDVSVECKHNQRYVSCTIPMPIGTVVRTVPRCTDWQSLPGDGQYRNIRCLSTGMWDMPVPVCRPTSVPTASRTCHALPVSSDVLLECKVGERYVVCSSGPMEIGTVATITPHCREGFVLPEESRYRNITCTSTGEWDKRVPTCRTAESSTCPALVLSNDVSVRCKHGERPVNCKIPMPIGTVARTMPQCADWRRLPGDNQYRHIRCLSTGMWDKPVPSCKPTAVAAPVLSCGVSARADGKPPMQSGVPVTAGEVPWHVGIYKLYNGKYEQVCSGTLINPKTILTAASCFWKTNALHAKLNSSIFRVAASKLSREWVDEDEYVQRRSVASVVGAELYTGVETSYQLNIAVMKVTEKFEINHYVNVACLNSDTNTMIQEQAIAGKVGNVPGWGFPEEESPGSQLKTVTMPHIAHHTCYEHLSPEVRRSLTQDKICAGSTNDFQGYTVCESDSGAGIVFFDESASKYYLHGVASVALKPKSNREECYPSHIVSFSTLSSVAEWIREKMN